MKQTAFSRSARQPEKCMPRLVHGHVQTPLFRTHRAQSTAMLKIRQPISLSGTYTDEQQTSEKQPSLTRRQLINDEEPSPTLPHAATAEPSSGPPAWPGTCSIGTQQSPVNLAVRDTVHQRSPLFKELVFQYAAPVEKVLVSNPGHGTMHVNFSPGKVFEINGEPHELLQYHFHTPSEHALDSKRFAMEAHLVHKSRMTGKLAVVGVMLEPGEEASAAADNACLQVGLDNAPATPGESVQLRQDQLPDPLALLPAPVPTPDGGHRAYVHYTGSLTTPPCSESVDWFVMTDPVQVSDHQVLQFMRFSGSNASYGQNARPLQPIDGRTIDYEL